ncbi:MAG: radical SAM protein [Thermoprotei archaeon]|nr:MAG: radical SAM protein [Thermoprotei archaeon]RLE56741.1 MAG: radical SAM protein [Thermoprotei archaeon]
MVGKLVEKVVIIDGYVDTPAGLGVPPYLDVFPRYVAGAVWSVNPSAQVLYFTVDYVRAHFSEVMKICNESDLVVFIAGVIVPGKYLGGEPIKEEELTLWPQLMRKPIKVLGGPVARFGLGGVGGEIATPPEYFSKYFDLVVPGDIEVVVHDLVREGLRVDYVDPHRLRESYREIREFAIKGARIVTQHPNYGKNLICEIETYRGCPRYITGGCSFCIEPLWGCVKFRDVEDVVEEIRALYEWGVRCFRIGRQPDLYAYWAKDTGVEEFPKPRPEVIERLFRGIRNVAPELETLHIDNVNPGTVYHHPREAREITKIIIKYHTPGDVAAFGIESADPRVVRLNNLKVMPDEALEAIRIICEVGSVRGWNGLPELLPGVNFVCGLIGETKETYYLNYIFLKKVLELGYLIRRVNIRQVLVLPCTRMASVGTSIIRRHWNYFQSFKRKVRKEIDLPMLRKVVPKGTVLKRAFTEAHYGGGTYARQVGTYPLLIWCPMRLELGKYMDFLVVDHGFRSVVAVPYPLDVNSAPLKVLKLIPGMTEDKVRKIMRMRPFKSVSELSEVVGELAKYFTVKN